MIKEISDKLIAPRSTLYGTISALFSDPESEKFSMIISTSLQGSALDACFQLEEKNNLRKTHLSSSFQKLMAKLDNSNLAIISNDFVYVFGHTLSKQIAPYALEHLKNKDLFFQTQKLADLNGFYKAFGLEVESIERADHISTQSEFLSFLLLKQCLAEKDSLSEEKKICVKAFHDFQRDHFLDWVEMFAKNLTTHIDSDFYLLAGKFLSEFLKIEKSQLNSSIKN
jgi:TorA maturation chaperone TorD